MPRPRIFAFCLIAYFAAFVGMDLAAEKARGTATEKDKSTTTEKSGGEAKNGAVKGKGEGENATAGKSKPIAAASKKPIAASRPSETLLPDTTQGFFAIANVDELTERWNKTQLGHLMAEPTMKPFTQDLRRQVEARWSSVQDRLGLTLEELQKLPSGDVGIGLVAPAPGKAAVVIVADVAGKIPQAREMLKQVTKRQLERGAKRSEFKVDGCDDTVIQFDLLEPEEVKEAQRSKLDEAKQTPSDNDAAAGSHGQEKAAGDKKEEKKTPVDGQAEEESPLRRAFYCLTGNLLIVADDLDVFKGVLGRAMGHSGGSLADHKPFQVVMERCHKDYGRNTPQMRWFIHPLGYAETARAATPPHRRRKGKTVLELMRNQGGGAVLGIGGLADFDAEGYELIHRTSIYAPPPYEKSMKMLKLPNHKKPEDFAPQPWVPHNVATYTTLYFDVLNGFDNFGPLFDELFAQRESGVWKEVLDGLKTSPNGPHIDLREDIIRHLGQRVTVLTDYQLPITTTSERLLFAVEATNPKAVAKGIRRWFENASDMKARKIHGHVIWEMVVEDAPAAQPKIEIGDLPPVAPARPPKKKMVGDDEEEEEGQGRLLPHQAVTVWEGNLLIASHIDFLLKVIDPPKKLVPLGGEADYNLIDREILKFDPEQKCLRFFSRTDEEYRTTYELIRQNKMPESESMLGRLLNALAGDVKEGTSRKQQIDGRKLPEFEAIRRYLGPAGMQVTSESNGWYLKGFTLRKPTVAPADQKPTSDSADKLPRSDSARP